MNLTWVIETNVNEAAERLAKAAQEAGDQVVRWDGQDDRGLPPDGARAVFYGSLQGCEHFRSRGWVPGVLGSDEELKFSAWIHKVKWHALNYLHHVVTTVDEVANVVFPWYQPEAPQKVFVRPDSALKPFSGRLLDADALTPEALDFGFYYEDPKLPIVLNPAYEIDAEWRFVAVNGRIVAGSGYQADGRKATNGTVDSEALMKAERLAPLIPEVPVVVIDICRSYDFYWLVEFNLFSGSDLYNCDVAAIVKAIREME